MAVWGPEAFDNDAAIEMVAGGTLTASENHTIDHLDNLLNSVAHNGPIDEDIASAYAACEIIAAARGGKIYWRTFSKIYWQTLGLTRDAKPPRAPYFPKEVDVFLQSKPVFDDETASRAIAVVGILHDKAKDTAGDTASASDTAGDSAGDSADLAARRGALERTLERLRSPFVPWEPGPIVRDRLSALADA